MRLPGIRNLTGSLSEADVAAISSYVINPVEAREASLRPALKHSKPPFPSPSDVEIRTAFVAGQSGLKDFLATHGYRTHSFRILPALFRRNTAVTNPSLKSGRD